MPRHYLCCGCREHTTISLKKAQVTIAKSLHGRKGWSSLTSWRWKEEIVGRDTEWSPQGSDASEDTEALFCLARGALPALAADHGRSCWVKEESSPSCGCARSSALLYALPGIGREPWRRKGKSPRGRWSIFNEPKPLPQIKWNILKGNNITLVLFVSAT